MFAKKHEGTIAFLCVSTDCLCGLVSDEYDVYEKKSRRASRRRTYHYQAENTNGTRHYNS